MGFRLGISLVERATGCVDATCQRAGAGAGDAVDRHAQFFQLLQYAEVGHAARTTTTEHEADAWPCGRGLGTSQPKSAAAVAAPNICATMNPNTEFGAIPANVLERLRAMVTAGLAKEVDAVNQ